MTLDIQTINGDSVCRLDGALSIWEAAGLWQQLQPLLGGPNPLIIDLGDVRACDGAGVQILCQLRRAVQHPAGRIRIQRISEPIGAALRLAGMDPQTLLVPAEAV
jgi:anti-anti-sigma factor